MPLHAESAVSCRGGWVEIGTILVDIGAQILLLRLHQTYSPDCVCNQAAASCSTTDMSTRTWSGNRQGVVT